MSARAPRPDDPAELRRVAEMALEELRACRDVLDEIEERLDAWGEWARAVASRSLDD